MAHYVQISSEEMDSFMEALGFRELSRESRGLTVKEKVYERPFHEGRIRVYSSVEDRPGRLAAGRKMGRDAIRVQYWIDDTKVFGAKRVHRVVNWRRNMLDRVYEIEDMFGHRPVPRDSSGEPMVVRTSKQGKKFWGSRTFPRNKDTRRFNAESFAVEEIEDSDWVCEACEYEGGHDPTKTDYCPNCGDCIECCGFDVSITRGALSFGMCGLLGCDSCLTTSADSAYMPYENFCVICDEQGGVDICEYCHTNADWVHANFFGEVPFRRISHKSHEMKEHDFVPMKPPNTYDRKTGKSKYDSFKRAESFDAGRKLRKKSCCCGADIKNPCACMKDGVMTCRADEPKCPCYAAKTEVKEAVVFAPRKPTGIVDKVMMNHAMMQEAQLQGMIEYMENMIQLGLLSEEEVMAELHKTFGSEYYFDDSLEDIVMDEYLEDEDYEDAEIYARNAMKKLNASSSTQKFHPRQKGTCVACGGKFSWNQERCLDCGSGANLWSFDTETFGVEAWDLDITTKFWFCAACNDRYEDQNDAEECCLESSYIDERGFWNIIHAEDEPMWCACGCAGKIADHDDRGYGCWPCIDCGDDSDTDINEVCSSCVGQTFSAEELTTQYGDNQEQYFRDKFYESEKVAQEASDYPLNHLGFWFEMADEPYGGHIRDMLEKPWNWRQEMTRYLFEGGYEGVMYGDDEDLFALGFDASYPPYLTLKELGELYDWMPTYEDYKGYVHNFYRAEYQEVNKSPLGVIVKGKDGKTYVLVPQDLAEIIFQQSKYVLDAEWRKEELLYSDELNDMMPISVGTMMFDKIYVATRNEGEDIVTYIVQEELIDEEKLYRILVVIDGPLGSTHKKYLEAVMDEM